MELKQNKRKQTQEALEKNKEHVKNKKIFEYEVEVPYKERVDFDSSVASMAMCCTVCEENCHYPESVWVKNLSKCSVMKNNHCTVCTNKCHYREHVKEAKIYVAKTKTEKRINEELKKKYDDKIRDGVLWLGLDAGRTTARIRERENISDDGSFSLCGNSADDRTQH